MTNDLMIVPDRQSTSPDLPLPFRVALDLVVIATGGTTGSIAAQVIGPDWVRRELERYAPIGDDSAVAVVAGAPSDETREAIEGTSPRRVVVVAPGSLARLLPLGDVGQGLALADLDGATWGALGYERTARRGVQGVGFSIWAIAERCCRLVNRPDLADRCRIGMLRTVVTWPYRWVPARLIVTTYRKTR
jgi:hypothetical protein